MPATLDDDALRRAFAEFRPRLEPGASWWADWRSDYLAHLRRIQSATPTDWATPAFQQALWESNAVSHIGPGTSVTIPGAYADPDLARLLAAAYAEPRASSVEDRGRRLQALFEQVLAIVHPRYNSRARPLARTVRLIAALFPSDMACLMDERRLWQVHRLVGAPRIDSGFIAHHALLRERLRQALGPTPSLEDEVDQSVFNWLLWTEHFDKPDPEAVAVTREKGRATDLPTLHLLPAHAQRKGLAKVGDNVDLLVAVLREAEFGIAQPALVEAITREAPQLKSSSAGNVISQAQGAFSLLRLEDGAYRPTERGLELLAAPDPGSVLRAPLIGRIFGIAHCLLFLAASPEGIPKGELARRLTALRPEWTSLWAGNELISWAVSTGLARRDGDGRVFLTEEGSRYVAALPADFEERWDLSGGRVQTDADDLAESRTDAPATVSTFQPAAFAAVAAAFDPALILPDSLLAELHAALHASSRKRFVLLSGLSGTGKTSVARAYAAAYCAALGLPDAKARYHQAAVRPDWTDPTGLLGFVNALAAPPIFQGTGALDLLLRADADRGRPYFLCLDEMNLARVEHYFAPFLSGMEGEGGRLELHGDPEGVGGVPSSIAWPANLFLFGTVNMDETTHAFSDKVLDRAFTFEFWDVDLARWRAGRAAGLNGAAPVLDAVAPVLERLQAALLPARRHFGYRTADEVLAFCVEGSAAGLAVPDLLDAAVHMKVLPRVRGDDSGPLETALQGLAAVAGDNNLRRTAAKTEALRVSLRETGQARFWS